MVNSNAIDWKIKSSKELMQSTPFLYPWTLLHHLERGELRFFIYTLIVSAMMESLTGLRMILMDQFPRTQ